MHRQLSSTATEGLVGRDLCSRPRAAPVFGHIQPMADEEALRRSIDARECLAGIVIRRIFSRGHRAGSASIQVILGRSTSNSAQIKFSVAI